RSTRGPAVAIVPGGIPRGWSTDLVGRFRSSAARPILQEPLPGLPGAGPAFPAGPTQQPLLTARTLLAPQERLRAAPPAGRPPDRPRARAGRRHRTADQRAPLQPVVPRPHPVRPGR